jgi:hypothetical protein
MRIGMWLIEQLNTPRWNPASARVVADTLARMLQCRDGFLELTGTKTKWFSWFSP